MLSTEEKRLLRNIIITCSPLTSYLLIYGRSPFLRPAFLTKPNKNKREKL